MLSKLFEKIIGRFFFWLTSPMRPTNRRIQPMSKQDREIWKLHHRRKGGSDYHYTLLSKRRKK